MRCLVSGRVTNSKDLETTCLLVCIQFVLGLILVVDFDHLASGFMLRLADLVSGDSGAHLDLLGPVFRNNDDTLLPSVILPWESESALNH